MQTFNPQQQMSTQDFNIDTSGYSAEARTQIPRGDYPMQVETFEVKSNKDQTGLYIRVDFTIIGGQYESRKTHENFNIQNASTQAVEIGIKKLKQLFIAATNGQCGTDPQINPQTLNALLGAEFLGTVGLDGEYNKMIEFKTKTGGRVGFDNRIVEPGARPGAGGFSAPSPAGAYTPPAAPPAPASAYSSPPQPQPAPAPAPAAAPPAAQPGAAPAAPQAPKQGVPAPWHSAPPAAPEHG